VIGNPDWVIEPGTPHIVALARERERVDNRLVVLAGDSTMLKFEVRTMKIITTMAVVASLLGSVIIAQAQNAPTSKEPLSPANINKGTEPGSQSGNESHAAAIGRGARISGTGKFCSENSANGPLDCVYASMSACKKHNKANNLECVANPDFGTTGSRH
jgi:hypothetical protein